MSELAATMRPAAEAGGPQAAVDAFFPLVCDGLWSQRDETAKDRHRANGPMMLAEFAGPPYQLDVKDVAALAVPCLVITGTQSHPALREIAAALARALPDARLTELAGSGHVTYAERPGEFAHAVAVFATEVTSQERSQATIA
jgi:pimeloyl-ACP methyl ester carboxylesterase